MIIFKIVFTLLLTFPVAGYGWIIISRWVKCINEINRENRANRSR